MARIRLVSRTIKTYVYNVTAFDRINNELVTIRKVITGDKPSEKDLLKELSDSDTIAVKADYVSYSEEMYVMSETDFLKYAHKAADGKRAIPETETEETESESEDAK